MDSDWQVRRWVPEIDPLRGIAASAVVLAHSIQVTGTGFLHTWLGQWGVLFFFVLSGFCIHLPHAGREYAQDHHLRLDWRRFYKRRARRLLWTHYAALVCAALVGLGSFPCVLISRPTVMSFLAHVAMVHVWYAPFFYSINSVFWTIAIEVHFYICYPLFLRMRQKLGLFLVPFLCLISLTIRMSAARFLAHHAGIHQVVDDLFLVHWWEWGLGTLLADIYVTGHAPPWLRIFNSPRAAWLWAALSLLVGYSNPSIGTTHDTGFLLPVLIFLLVEAVITNSRSHREFPALAYVGSFSYSLYLMHPVAMALISVLLADLPLLVAIPGYFLVSYPVSWLFFMAIERHFLSERQLANLQTIVPVTDLPVG